MEKRRNSGILLHISSLPSPYGIGNIGESAYRFIDFLTSAGQSLWQMLPQGHTGFGNSPYAPFSAFAGNPLLIDLSQLAEVGYIREDEVRGEMREEGRADYTGLIKTRYPLLEKAYKRFILKMPSDFEEFCVSERARLEDYALFMSIKDEHGDTPWYQWYTPVKMRDRDAINECKMRYRERMEFYYFLQYEFSRQWRKLRAYAKEKGITLVGDIPIYVPLDSADVWAHPELFQLSENRMPREVAGCPPDSFNPKGQKWGNPLYDWDKMAENDYGWWRDRLRNAVKYFDVLRIDHFRAIESYYACPSDDESTENGRWIKGPGMDFISHMKEILPNAGFIAEDLGFITPEVKQLQRVSGIPGMKVLEFAFDPREDGNYLPHTYTRDCVCYPATHDNAPLAKWEEELDGESLAFAREYLNVSPGESLARAVIRAGMASVANTFICQMQDWLELGEISRMNRPGTVSDKNWSWRATPDAFSPTLARRIRKMTELYGRL